MADLMEFTWEVRHGGYEWIEARPVQAHRWKEPDALEPGESLFLVAREANSSNRSTAGSRLYQPLLEQENLFQIFALTEPSSAGILKFADKYGELGSRYREVIEVDRDRQEASLSSRFNQVERILAPLRDDGLNLSSSIEADPAEVWFTQIYKMRLALELWGLLNNRDEKGLSEYFSLHGASIVAVDPRPRSKNTVTISVSLTQQLGDNDIKNHNLVQFARAYLYCSINLNMNGLVLPQLVAQGESGLATLRIIPSSLIGALWLQFAQAVDRTRKYKQCEACGKWFDISRRFGARADKKTCDAKCRMRLSRKFAREKVL